MLSPHLPTSLWSAESLLYDRIPHLPALFLSVILHFPDPAIRMENCICNSVNILSSVAGYSIRPGWTERSQRLSPSRTVFSDTVQIPEESESSPRFLSFRRTVTLSHALQESLPPVCPHAHFPDTVQIYFPGSSLPR